MLMFVNQPLVKRQIFKIWILAFIRKSYLSKMQSIFNLSALKITPLSVLDIFLVAFIIYQLYNLVKGTIAVNIFVGFLFIYLLYFIVPPQMPMLSAILKKFAEVIILATIIVFQTEIRRFLLLVGKNASLQRNKAWWQYFFGKAQSESNNYARIKPIIDACKVLKQTRTGALIVFTKYYDEQFFQNSCEVIEGKISKRLLESIFQKTSPLHDGAVVISENKIKSASCILPLTDKTDLPPQFGLRHRAGIGVTESNEATALIVSEETGEISYAKQGKVKMNISFAELEKLLNKDF